ncbi:MAG: hypothetical protein M3N52_13605 [Actinomycetota bacterium]|nr:hypothetical protein [Actinomycetota bacterium]
MTDDAPAGSDDPRDDMDQFGPRAEADDATHSDAGLTGGTGATAVPGTAHSAGDEPDDPQDAAATAWAGTDEAVEADGGVQPG